MTAGPGSIPKAPPQPLEDAELAEHLALLIAGSPTLMQVLTTLRALDLPDWRLFSGAVYQTVWNALTERDADYGIKDYDIGYFDADTGWDAEDRVIKHVAERFSPALAAKVEVRNQARVHLWFEQKFNEPYAPLACTDEALLRFVCPAFAVGVRLERDDALTVSAPFGLGDLFTMRLRRNPTRAISDAAFSRVTDSAQARWPELEILR
jgi:hypothetical protein